MPRSIAAACALLLCALLMTAEVGTASTGPSGKPRIGAVHVERAPVGGKGSLTEAFVTCPNNAYPHVRPVAKGLDSDFRVVWKYRSDVWVWYGTRVDTGRYKVTTTARCGSKKSRRVEVVNVKRKTSKTTISPQEFRRIKRGMTRSRVRRSLATQDPGSRTWRSYDHMTWNGHAGASFRDGHVTRTTWSVPLA